MKNRNPESSDFRQQVKRAREHSGQLWEGSRKYLSPSNFQEALPGLLEQIRGSSFDSVVVEQVTEALKQFGGPEGSGKNRKCFQVLKALTGFPPAKAVRAIMIWGHLNKTRQDPPPAEELSAELAIRYLQEHDNPYEVLFQVSRPSLLDIGAGDLTFEQELAEFYRTIPAARKGPLVLHAFDRLHPGSKVGGVFHRNLERERFLKRLPPEELQFRFWGNMDLASFSTKNPGITRYTIVTCHAPANPTFAFEPARLDSGIIRQHLRATRGEFQPGEFEGEPVLEVFHRGHVLTFPSWKFQILGPLQLLEFMTMHGRVGVVSAVDDEVFWEMLAQLLEDERYRPKNRILTPDVRGQIFGEIFEVLQNLSEGDRLDLSRLASIRDPLPWNRKAGRESVGPCRLKYVEIRRGAVIPGIPSSFTARQFKEMNEESTPWWIIFVAD